MKTWVLNIFSEYFIRILEEGKEIEARVPDLDVPQKHYHKIIKGDILILRLIDPGYLQYKKSCPDNEWKDIDVLLVTHKYADHCYVDANRKRFYGAGPRL